MLSVDVRVRIRAMVRAMARLRIRFAFRSFGFSFTEYIHAASCSMWCVREIVDAIFDLFPLDEALRESLCWGSREDTGQRAAAVWRGRA